MKTIQFNLINSICFSFHFFQMLRRKRRDRISAFIFKIGSFQAELDFDSNEEFIGTKAEKFQIIKSIKSAIEIEKLKNNKKDDAEKALPNGVNNEDDIKKNNVVISKEQKRNSIENSSEEIKKESIEIIDENHFVYDNSNDLFTLTENDIFFNDEFNECNINYFQCNDMLDDCSHIFL